MQVERKFQVKSDDENCVIIEHRDGYNSGFDKLSEKQTHSIMGCWAYIQTCLA